MSIPTPPRELVSSYASQFLPDPDMPAFIHETFISDKGDLFNPDHQHLSYAEFGVLWTNVENKQKSRRIIATVQEAEPKGKPWGKQMKEVQLEEWFGDIPDFLITIDANIWMEFTNDQRCAVLEHELYHIRQATDEFGMPRFQSSTGRPMFKIVGHDVEEFIGVAQRYGAYSEELKQMKRALDTKPDIEIESIEGVCGTCMSKVA